MEIKFKNVSVGLSDCVLNDLSFDICEKKITFVVGESGSGKSLLLSLINGDIPYDGEIIRNMFYNITRKMLC